MPFQVQRCQKGDIGTWNDFAERTNGGTIFHRLGFLSYHLDRFKRNEHHLIIFKGNKTFSIMPMAVFENEGINIAKSPYGGSYGGPVFLNIINYRDSGLLISSILEYLKASRINQLSITLPYSVLYHRYSDTFRFALMERGFSCTSRDIVSAVCLDDANQVSGEYRRKIPDLRRKARKATRYGTKIVKNAPVGDFWKVLEKTYSRLGVEPTHTLEEFRWLNRRFPKLIYSDVAYIEGKPAAGIGYIVLNKRVKKSFYLCQDPEKRQSQALTALLYDALDEAGREGFSWFDFGTSSISMKGNANIFRFKEGFGAVGVFRETYTWKAPVNL